MLDNAHEFDSQIDAKGSSRHLELLSCALFIASLIVSSLHSLVGESSPAVVQVYPAV